MTEMVGGRRGIEGQRWLMYADRGAGLAGAPAVPLHPSPPLQLSARLFIHLPNKLICA